MSKFLYKYDINKYLDKAKELILKDYPWVTEDMLDTGYEYKIEKVGNIYEFVAYYEDHKAILDWIKSDKDFYNLLKSRCESNIERHNPIIETFKMPIDNGTSVHGWYLERYEFNKHFYGGYSAFVQAGDRTTGGSRTFFIPNDYFDGTYYEFLDKYLELVPTNHFGMSREEFEDNKELAKFLGFNK